MFEADLGAVSVGASTTTYLYTHSTSFSAESSRQMIMAASCSLTNLVVRTSSTQSSTGDLAITMRVNGASTAVTLTIAASTTSGTFSDTAHSAAVNPGDLVSIQLANAATATSAAIKQYGFQCK